MRPRHRRCPPSICRVSRQADRSAAYRPRSFPHQRVKRIIRYRITELPNYRNNAQISADYLQNNY